MQEAVNSVMLWLTKCQKTVEVCSHLFRQKRLDFKEVDDLRSDQGCPRYSSTQYVRWHVRKQWEELSTCSYWWLCVHTFTRFGRWSIPFMSVCLLSQNWHPPTTQKSVVRPTKSKCWPAFLIHVCRSTSQSFLWLKLTNLSLNWSICQLSIKLYPLVTSRSQCTPVGALLSLGGESSATVDQLDLDQLLVHHGGHHPLWHLCYRHTWVKHRYKHKYRVSMKAPCLRINTHEDKEFKHLENLFWSLFLSESESKAPIIKVS